MSKAATVGEEMHNVFPGNKYVLEQVLPFPEENEPEQMKLLLNSPTLVSPRTSNAFKIIMVLIGRAKEALKLVEQDIDSFQEEERKQLMQAVEELNQSLTQFRLKIL